MSDTKNLAIFCMGLSFGVAIMMLNDHASMRHQYEFGFERGQKTALSTHPPSEELEMVCASLWVGKQNQIYIEREARKK